MDKKLFRIFILWAVLVICCTFCRFYGPFSGKVADAETGQPIRGAVVLIGFYTKSPSVGGMVWSFADAVEILTDENGEFQLPLEFVYSFQAFAVWEDDCEVSIFKPSYGAYPMHPKVFCTPNLQNSMVIPEKEYITFHLPRLATRQEREENLMNIWSPGGITSDKMTMLKKLEDEEYAYVFGP